jgi:hypothetical protein
VKGSDKFPESVTDSTDQSRTLGAQLNSILGGKAPAEIIAQPEVFQKLMRELWHNLACLTDESVMHCLPFYFNLNGAHSAYSPSPSDSPEVWQLNEDYAYRLLSVTNGNLDSSRMLEGLDEDERLMLVELCATFEQETEESFEPVLKLAGII